MNLSFLPAHVIKPMSSPWHGADPEVLAYAMAKYSRSSISMRESLIEISSQRAEQFLNTFYFQYGHRSIADLAHVALAIERLSLLAAIVLVDEQRWDGQERSTRYQNFRKSGWYFPDFGTDTASATLYSKTAESLFAAYERTTAAVLEALRHRIACPEAMKPEAYQRTLKARAFDVAPLPAPPGHQHLALARFRMPAPLKLRSRACSLTPPRKFATWESSSAKPPPVPPWNVNGPGRRCAGWKNSPPSRKRPVRSWLPKPPTCSRARSASPPRWSNMPSPANTKS